MDKINIKRVLICFNDKKERTNTKIMQSQGENPHDHDTAESKIMFAHSKDIYTLISQCLFSFPFLLQMNSGLIMTSLFTKFL